VKPIEASMFMSEGARVVVERGPKRLLPLFRLGVWVVLDIDVTVARAAGDVDGALA
jgi:hypothetical protein